MEPAADADSDPAANSPTDEAPNRTAQVGVTQAGCTARRRTGVSLQHARAYDSEAVHNQQPMSGLAGEGPYARRRGGVSSILPDVVEDCSNNSGACWALFIHPAST